MNNFNVNGFNFMLGFPKTFVFREGITCLHGYNPKFCTKAIFRDHTL